MPVGRGWISIGCSSIRILPASYFGLSLLSWLSLLWNYHLPLQVTIFICLFDICVSDQSLSPELINFLPNTVPPFVFCVSADRMIISPTTYTKKWQILVNSLSRGFWNPCLHVIPHSTDLIQLLLSQSFSEYLSRAFYVQVSWKKLRMW